LLFYEAELAEQFRGGVALGFQLLAKDCPRLVRVEPAVALHLGAPRLAIDYAREHVLPLLHGFTAHARRQEHAAPQPDRDIDTHAAPMRHALERPTHSLRGGGGEEP